MKSIKEQIEEQELIKMRADSKIEEIVRTSMPEFNSLWNTAGSWDCEDSPLGVCVYNHIEDPALDYCLFCGEPDERK